MEYASSGKLRIVIGDRFAFVSRSDPVFIPSRGRESTGGFINPRKLIVIKRYPIYRASARRFYRRTLRKMTLVTFAEIDGISRLLRRIALNYRGRDSRRVFSRSTVYTGRPSPAHFLPDCPARSHFPSDDGNSLSTRKAD